MYEYEVECMVVSKESGRHISKYQVKFRKPKEQWTTTDYDILERYLGRRKDIKGDVSIIEVRDIECQTKN